MKIVLEVPDKFADCQHCYDGATMICDHCGVASALANAISNSVRVV